MASDSAPKDTRRRHWGMVSHSLRSQRSNKLHQSHLETLDGVQNPWKHSSRLFLWFLYHCVFALPKRQAGSLRRWRWSPCWILSWWLPPGWKGEKTLGSLVCWGLLFKGRRQNWRDAIAESPLLLQWLLFYEVCVWKGTLLFRSEVDRLAVRPRVVSSWSDWGVKNSSSQHKWVAEEAWSRAFWTVSTDPKLGWPQI